MRFDLVTKDLSTLPVECIVVGVFQEGMLSNEGSALDTACGGRLNAAVARGDVSGNTDDTLLLVDLPGIKACRVLLTGLGPRKGYDRKVWRKAVASSVGALARTRICSAAFALPRPKPEELDDYELGRAMAEIVCSSLYRTNHLKTGKKPKPETLKAIFVGSVRDSGRAAARRGLSHGAALGSAIRLHRDLGNLPANICTPSYLADQARKIGKRFASVKVTVLGEAALRREKMGCLLAVAQGGGEPAHFLVLEYRGGNKTEAPIVLVGKGVTFDTGGISLKSPPNNMDLMKYDMLGAGTVLACLMLTAELGLPLNVVGLVATCENMPSERAVKPGDIVTSASGQTVEILNTDAEGRLLLCDALHYARRFKPSAVIDIATLTGSVIAALGTQHSGVMSNDDALSQELMASGLRADDRAWQLPLMDEYAEPLKSEFADLANYSYGILDDAAAAAAFLSQFTKGMKWAHLDVAGTAYTFRPKKGVTGRPIPMLADFLIQRARKRA
jgi:leucyl aminopeptidase